MAKQLIRTYFSRSNSVFSGFEEIPYKDVPDETDYDTDLEDDRPIASIIEGSHCQKRYMKACRKLKTEPMNFVFWSLDRTALHIGNRYPNEREMLACAIGIAVNTTLVELRFTHNNLSLRSILYTSAAVWENSNISYLEISGNGLCDTSLRIIIDLVKSSLHLSALVLSNNRIRDMQGGLVAELITANRSVLHLGLSYNQLGDTAAKQIGDALKNDQILQELDLSWNCIRTKGAEVFCECLKKNTMLRTLNMHMNGVGTVGAGYFSRLLINNSTLEEVDLSQNRIYDQGYGYLAKMVLKNENLSRLSIGNNPVSTVGVKVFLQALMKSKRSNLKNVDMEGTYISREMEELVSALKKLNPNLKMDFHGVVNKDNVIGSQDPNDNIIKMHPLEIMRYYIEKTGSRLIDVFRMFDKQKRNEITKEDFAFGLKKMNIPLTPAQINDLISILDSTNSGSINFGEMVDGDKEARARLRKRRERDRRMSKIVKRNDFSDL